MAVGTNLADDLTGMVIANGDRSQLRGLGGDDTLAAAADGGPTEQLRPVGAERGQILLYSPAASIQRDCMGGGGCDRGTRKVQA